jgi:mannose-6-phosphate isomerase-like protein (cupin superfamily)
MRKIVVKPSEFRSGAPMESFYTALGEAPPVRDWKVIYPEIVPGVKTLTLGIVEVAPGHHTPLHKHNCEEVYYVLSGRGKVRVDNREYEIEEGDAVYIPENTPHCVYNVDHSKILKYIAVGGIMLVSLLPEWPTKSPYEILEQPKK